MRPFTPRQLLFVLACLLALPPTLQAAPRSLHLGEISASQGQIRAFHSFQAKVLVVAFTQPETAANACKLNQYHIYDYANEVYRQVQAADLLLSRDFQAALIAEPLTLTAITKNELEPFTKKVEEIAQSLQAPSSLLEETGTMRGDGMARCWLRPSLLNLATGEATSFPLILANHCPPGLCSKLEWDQSNQPLVWVRLKPELFHQVKLDAKTGKFGFLGQKKPFTLARAAQDNAYRANVVIGPQGKFALDKSPKNQSWLEWETAAGKLSARLVRTGVEVKRAKALAQQLQGYNQRQQWAAAQGLTRFAQWVDPDGESLAYQALLTKALSGDLAGFFASLRKDFDFKTRVATCRQLHLDADLKPLWAQPEFVGGFKETCP